MYRKDMFEQAGIKVNPDPTNQPTWQEVAGWADSSRPMTGRYLPPRQARLGRAAGPAGHGDQYLRRRWFDENWNAQLNSPEVKKAVNFYVDLVKRSGELGASSAGFQECANLFGQGQTAMWYDATSAVSVLEDPRPTRPAGQDRVSARPDRREAQLWWLYTWALGIPKAAKNRILRGSSSRG